MASGTPSFRTFHPKVYAAVVVVVALQPACTVPWAFTAHHITPCQSEHISASLASTSFLQRDNKLDRRKKAPARPKQAESNPCQADCHTIHVVASWNMDCGSLLNVLRLRYRLCVLVHLS
ncbi:hypothetical protein BDW62DRAFT_126377 [Aspergillus aurantiobrunneus]